MYYVEEEMGNLVRALQFTPPERRESYFQELRSCRRRKRKEWQITPLATLFAQPDYYALVDFRSIIIAVRTLIKIKGMKLLDAFRAFDYNRDGRLSCSELYGGLEWLGMSLQAEDIYAIVRHVDKTGLGFIFYEHFEASFKDPEEDDQLNSMVQRVQKQDSSSSDGWLMDDTDGFKTASVVPKKIKELSAGEEKEDEQRQEEIMAHHLPKLSVAVEKVATHSFVWNSRGTLTRKDLSIWAGINPTAILRGRNKARINLGHYAASGYGKPEKNIAPGSISSLTLEITDTEVSTMFRSANLTLPKLNWLCPHPVNYKLSWNLVAKDFTLYVWRPIPPDANHVALGMYATITTDPPPLTAMRCVPKGWVQQVQKEPKMLWDDSGIGGRRGSVWQVNSLHLLYAKEGYDPPEGPFFEILGKKFAASEGLIAIIEGMETNKKAPPVDTQPNFLEDARPGSAANPMGGGMPIPVMPARVKNAYKQEVRLTRALREANEQAEALSFFNNRSVIPLSAMPVLAFHAQAPESMAEEIAAHNAQFMPQQQQHQSYGAQAGALVGDATAMLGNAAAAVSSGIHAGAQLAVTGAKFCCRCSRAAEKASSSRCQRPLQRHRPQPGRCQALRLSARHAEAQGHAQSADSGPRAKEVESAVQPPVAHPVRQRCWRPVRRHDIQGPGHCWYWPGHVRWHVSRAAGQHGQVHVERSFLPLRSCRSHARQTATTAGRPVRGHEPEVRTAG